MEGQLIRAAKDRDPEALAQLLVDLSPLTRATIRRIQPYAADPDNLSGEANVILLEALDDFDEERGVPFHLFYRQRLSYFLMDDLKRRMKHKDVPLTDEVVAYLASEEDTEGDLVARERARELHVAVNNLPDRERAVIAMYFFLDLSLSEIGGKLNLSYQTVANTKVRAMKRLRRFYAHQQEADSL